MTTVYDTTSDGEVRIFAARSLETGHTGIVVAKGSRDRGLIRRVMARFHADPLSFAEGGRRLVRVK